MIRASSPLDAMAQRLAHVFEQPALLRQALTHRSYSATHNERLEFLGDSVLNCVVATLLYQRFPELDEGELSRVRANLVRQETLHGIAQRLDVSGALALGEGELKSGGKQRPSILADAVEALFGAIYLDGGFVAAFNAIARAYDPVFAALDPDMLGKDANKDAKTLLQERLQGRQMALPVYTVVATIGAAHNQEFEVACTVEPLGIAAHGHGTSRRAAEMAAAKAALALMPAEGARGAKAAAVRKDSARGQGRPAKAGAPAADGKQIKPSHKTLRVLRAPASGSSSGNADRPGAAADEALTVERTGETAGRADRPTGGKRPVRRAGPAAK
ncbi:ribonuclease III [Robbsia andropogonis]|uniref:ribonuclease III n=1 Tax=Robbsia andropogonis TaxID=28092 RepID=UPI002A6B0C75|nr:ribonuclease III [Robbsia andropogonis]